MGSRVNAMDNTDHTRGRTTSKDGGLLLIVQDQWATNNVAQPE